MRFNRTERLVHWVQASAFLILLATGLMISVSALATVIGHRALLREIHLVTAFFFVFGPAIVVLAGNTRSIREDMRAVDEWTGDDIRWLAHPTVEPDDYSPPPGRYNAGQKLNAIFTVYATLAFAATGLILWQNRRFPFQLVSQANAIHTYLAYFAMAVFLGHLFLSTVYPATRKGFMGIINGSVDRDWAQDHHPAWQPAVGAEPALTIKALLRSAALLAIFLEAALLLTRFGLIWLGANVTDPATKMIYRFSGLPATLSHPATGVHAIDVAALLWSGLAIAVGLGLARRQDLLPTTYLRPAKS